MLISGSMNTEKVRKKKYLNGIEMKKQRENPFAFFMSKMKQAVIFLPIFEYKKECTCFVRGRGEYVDRVS